jgi:large subunit ribosomal protein L10
MVSQKKRETVKDVKSLLKDCSVIGILDMTSLPARQLHDMRKKMKDNARIMMVKKRLISIILKESGLKGQPALLMSKENPFRLARMIAESKSPAPARGGDIAPIDILVKAGPTSLPAGPVIGELQKVKIPAMIEGDKIAIRQDTLLVKEGEEISPEQADIMAKLGIEPMEIGLDMVAALEDGIIYSKDVLFVPQEEYLNDLKNAAQRAFNLTCSIGYYTSQNIGIFLSRAHSEAFGLSMEAGLVNSETIGFLLSKGYSQAEALKAAAKLPAETGEQAKEEVKEEKKTKEEKPAEEVEAKEEKREETPTEEKEEEAPKEEAPAEKKEGRKPKEEKGTVKQGGKKDANQEVE